MGLVDLLMGLVDLLMLLLVHCLDVLAADMVAVNVGFANDAQCGLILLELLLL